MNYRIENQIIIDKPNYGALGDDFSFNDLEAIDIITKKIETVLIGRSKMESIYGNMCYKIDVYKEISSIYCYDEYLGEEPTLEIYNMLKEYRDKLKESEDDSFT